jgi:hypothetical protein
MDVIVVGPFHGQRMSLGGTRPDQALFWIPDDPEETVDVGFCFDLPITQVDNLINLLQQLKSAAAVPVQLHSVQSDDEPEQ